MISAERLRELYDASPNVLLRVTDNELRGLGPLIRDVLDELEAARSRIAELEAACKALYADAHGDGFDSGPSFVPQGLSQEDREAIELGFIMIEQAADDYDNEGRGDGTRSKAWRAKAAILRSLGGQRCTNQK